MASSSQSKSHPAAASDPEPLSQTSGNSLPASPRVLVAICTYQEAENIEAILAALRDALPNADLLVVDDSSPDGTSDLVRQRQAEDSKLLLNQRTDERGLGSAIVSAMQHATEQGYEFFINLDADFSHDPQALPAMLTLAVEDPQIDVVIGSRYVKGGNIIGWPLRRRVISKLLNTFATTCLGLPVSDCSGSMRCYRVSRLQQISLATLQCTGYAVLEELLVRIQRSGGKMAELPITFTERERGQSKLSLGEAIRSVKFLLKLAWQLRIRRQEV